MTAKVSLGDGFRAGDDRRGAGLRAAPRGRRVPGRAADERRVVADEPDVPLPRRGARRRLRGPMPLVVRLGMKTPVGAQLLEELPFEGATSGRRRCGSARGCRCRSCCSAGSTAARRWSRRWPTVRLRRHGPGAPARAGPGLPLAAGLSTRAFCIHCNRCMPTILPARGAWWWSCPSVVEVRRRPAPEPSKTTARPDRALAPSSPCPRDRRRVPPAEPARGACAVVEHVESAGVAELWLWEDCFLEGGLTTAAARSPGRPGCGSASGSRCRCAPAVADDGDRHAGPHVPRPAHRRPRARRAALDGAGRRSGGVAHDALLREHVDAVRALLAGGRSTSLAVRPARPGRARLARRRRHRGCW